MESESEIIRDKRWGQTSPPPCSEILSPNLLLLFFLQQKIIFQEVKPKICHIKLKNCKKAINAKPDKTATSSLHARKKSTDSSLSCMHFPTLPVPLYVRLTPLMVGHDK